MKMKKKLVLIALLLMSGAVLAAGEVTPKASDPAPEAAKFVAQFYSVPAKDADVKITSQKGSEVTAITSAPGKGNCILKMVQIPNSSGGFDWMFAGGMSCDKAASPAVSG
jgi:hypothetical protein